MCLVGSITSAPNILIQKSLECLAGGFTPAPGIHFGMLGGKFHFKAPSPGSCLSPNSTSEKAHQMVTPPQGGSRPLPQAI